MTHEYNPFWQQRIRETVLRALDVHPRLTALRVDLRLPDVPAATDAAVISRFINALKARINAYQKRKRREGKRVHPTTLHYAWAREFGELKGKKHYHLLLLVNRDTWCRAGDYRDPGSLAGMIKQAWCSALGVDTGDHTTLVHFPVRPAVWLARNDDTGFQQVLERADYLAKESTKAYGTGERNFGCSRG
ncbi:inovirus Gp2 family protein [Escherichia coli]|uniref:inovirus Gp2 family protein n=1 Tax=Escherichia coli TaxID=562 RepID=UPI00287AFC68|nr:inovirus Gp2 family protein [Escherichia coli]MDS2077023.1 inovirus Gp2 family protein [Escherichia coli]